MTGRQRLLGVTPSTQPAATPTRKVTAGGVAGAVATILVAVLAEVGVEVDPITAAAIVTVLQFAGAYVVRESARA